MLTNKNSTISFTGFIFCLFLSFVLLTCESNKKNSNEDMSPVTPAFEPGTFGYDLEFLKKFSDVILLKDVSPRPFSHL